MSKVDTVFGGLAPPLIKEWGQPVVYIRSTPTGTYDPVTGRVTQTKTRIPVSAVIATVSPSEYQGLYQSTDIKIIPDPAPIRPGSITEEDSFERPKATGGVRTAKVIDVKELGGELPALFVVIARPQ